MIHVILPYLGTISYSLEKKVSNLIEAHYSTVTLKIVCKTPLWIGNLFRFKDKIPKPQRSSIIYKFSCIICDAIYIRKTSRNLFMSIEEKGLSFRTTNYILTMPIKYSIRSHSGLTNHPFSTDDFNISDSSQFDLDFNILECEFEKKTLSLMNIFLP